MRYEITNARMIRLQVKDGGMNASFWGRSAPICQ